MPDHPASADIRMTSDPAGLADIRQPTTALAVLQAPLNGTLAAYLDALDIPALARSPDLLPIRGEPDSMRFVEFWRSPGDRPDDLATGIARQIPFPAGDSFNQLAARLHDNGEHFAAATQADYYNLRLIFASAAAGSSYHTELDYAYRGIDALRGKHVQVLVPGDLVAAYPRGHPQRRATRPELVRASRTFARGDFAIFSNRIEHAAPRTSQPRLTAVYGLPGHRT